MIETYFLVPLRFNDGRPVPKGHYKELQAKLLAEFGGWTLGGQVQGAWQNASGTVFEDSSLKYIVAVATEADVDRVIAVARWACEKFQQEAIYFAVTGTAQFIAQNE